LLIAREIQRLQMQPGRFSRALAVTEEVRRDLTQELGVPATSIDVVPYAVDLNQLANPDPSELRRAIGARPEEPVALFVGHDFERKGLREAIGAVAAVSLHLHLAVIGDGRVDQYRQLAWGAGVGDRVHFLGLTDGIERYLSGADLFLLPTREDVWAIAVIEAMAGGVPVIMTEAAGTSAVVREANAGIVVADGSVAEIRDAIDRLLGDEALRRGMGKRGQAAAQAFSINEVTDRVVASYTRVLAERATSQ
jgi:UDP-glucose:(heptosyl)LPS alpha-1,3-glucosyltransferase